MTELTLPQAYLLLALSDDRGAIADSMRVPYGLVGAAIMELVLDGNLELADGRLVARRPLTVDDDILADLYAQVEAKPRKPKAIMTSWLSQRILTKVGKQLVNLGLVADRAKRLGPVTLARYFPALDGRPEADIRVRMDAVLQGATDVRAAALVALVSESGITKKVFPDAGPATLARVKEVAAADFAAAQVSDAIRQVQLAIGVALAAAVVSASSS